MTEVWCCVESGGASLSYPLGAVTEATPCELAWRTVYIPPRCSAVLGAVPGLQCKASQADGCCEGVLQQRHTLRVQLSTPGTCGPTARTAYCVAVLPDMV